MSRHFLSVSCFPEISQRLRTIKIVPRYTGAPGRSCKSVTAMAAAKSGSMLWQ